MYVKGPDNALLNLSNAGSSRARGNWQVGQLLKAMVVDVDRQGAPTLEINGRRISAQAQGGMPLRPGQMLQLEVVETGKTPLLKVLNPPVNPQETMSRGVRESLPQQQPLTQVLNTLQQLAQNAKGDAGQQLRALSRQLMEQLPQPQQLQSGPGVRQAVEDSGSFLEAKLQQLLRNSGNPESSAQLGRDLKAGLLRLLQAVRGLQQGTTTADARTPAPTAGQSQPGAQTAPNPPLPGIPAGTAQTPQGSTQPPPQAAQEQPGQNPGQLRQGPGQAQTAAHTAPQGAQRADVGNPARQPQTPVSHTAAHDASQLATKPGMDTSQQLESGLARIQFNQLHSIQQSDNQHKPSWLLEIPIRQAEGRVETLQLEIQRDREGDGKEKRAIWTVSLSFELKDLGAVRAGLTLVGEKQVGISLWTDRADTAELFNHQLDKLRSGMQEAGLYVNRVGVQQGIPKTPPSHKPFSDNGLLDVKA